MFDRNRVGRVARVRERGVGGVANGQSASVIDNKRNRTVAIGSILRDVVRMRVYARPPRRLVMESTLIT